MDTAQYSKITANCNGIPSIDAIALTNSSLFKIDNVESSLLYPIPMEFAPLLIFKK